MKLTQQRSFVKVEGALNSQTFKVQEGPKLIKLLSENLYKDKILAIVRELSTNCLDAHQKAGRPNEQFTIKLPTSFNGNFEIRDYGLGLNPNEIENIYRWYGRSDKEDDNSMVGALGLGAKCPFSYHTKTFTIESIYEDSGNTKKDIYSAYINEDGIPNIDLLSSEDSDDKTGVKVCIPCNKLDVSNFAVAAARIFPWFDVKPKFIGQSLPNIPKVENVLENPDWAIRKENYGLHDGLVAKMGVLTYPIRFDDTNLSSEIRELFNCPITLTFNLGDLDINPGREDLSYDTRTKSNIVAKCKKIIGELKDKVENELKACKSLYHARRKIGEVLSKIPSSRLRSIIPVSSFRWNNKPLFEKDVISYGYYTHIPNDFNGVGFSVSRIDIPYKSIRVRQSRNLGWDEKFVLMEADAKIGNQTRAKEYIQNNNATVDVVILLSFPSPTEKQLLLKFLGADDSDLIKASSLPKPQPVPRATGGGTKNITTRVMELAKESSVMSNCWQGTNIDINTNDGVYCEFNQYAAWDGDTKILPNALWLYIKNLNILRKKYQKQEIKTVYGIKTALISKLAKVTTKWQNVFDIIRQTMDEIAQDNDFVAAKQLGGQFLIGGADHIKRGNGYSYDYLYRLSLDELLTLKKLVKNQQYIDLITKLELQKNKIDKYQDIIGSYNTLEENFYKPKLKSAKITESPAAIEKEIYIKFPLLRELRSDFNDFNMLVPYVNNV